MKNIKVLYLTISFDKNGNNLYNDLVNELLENNHNVTVVRSSNEGEIQTDDTIGNSKLSIINVKTSNIFSNNIIGKGLSTIMIGHLFKKSVKNLLLNEKFDLLIYATPPITFNNVVKFCKKKFGCKTFLMLKDIFPQNAVDLGMFRKNGIVYGYFRKKEKSLYMLSDYIGCMSNGNIEYLKNNNEYININKVGLFPNSIKIRNLNCENIGGSNYIQFIFGGNLGRPQNIKGLLEIIDGLKDYKKAKFVICGNGTEVGLIKDYIKLEYSSKNVLYYDKLPKQEYDKILNKSDIGLISLDPRFTIPNIPSKLQNYMMLKKPILAIVDRNTDIPSIIEDAHCGWAVCSEDISGAIEKIKEICELRTDYKEMGRQGFSYLLNHYNIEDNVKIIERFMEEKYE
ncbi:MAG: glycosyltransferase family 4 protein [Erysipelotrichaceae bacterium]